MPDIWGGILIISGVVLLGIAWFHYIAVRYGNEQKTILGFKWNKN